MIPYLLIKALISTPALFLILYLIIKFTWLPANGRTFYSGVQTSTYVESHYAKVIEAHKYNGRIFYDHSMTDTSFVVETPGVLRCRRVEDHCL